MRSPKCPKAGASEAAFVVGPQSPKERQAAPKKSIPMPLAFRVEHDYAERRADHPVQLRVELGRFESISSSSPNTCSNELPTSSRFTQPLPRRTPSDSKRTPLGCNDGLAPLSGRPYARPPCGRARRRLDGAFRPAEHFHRHPQQQPHAIRPCQPGFLGSLR